MRFVRTCADGTGTARAADLGKEARFRTRAGRWCARDCFAHLQTSAWEFTDNDAVDNALAGSTHGFIGARSGEAELVCVGAGPDAHIDYVGCLETLAVLHENSTRRGKRRLKVREEGNGVENDGEVDARSVMDDVPGAACVVGKY